MTHLRPGRGVACTPIHQIERFGSESMDLLLELMLGLLLELLLVLLLLLLLFVFITY